MATSGQGMELLSNDTQMLNAAVASAGRSFPCDGFICAVTGRQVFRKQPQRFAERKLYG